MDAATFTRTAARMVRRNDRLSLRGYLLRATRRVAVLWCSFALAGLVLAQLPINMRSA